jgi:CheY-like chemotaxis protein
LRGDPYKIKQILGNLASNALKFTPSGGSVEFAIKRYDLNPEYLVIECVDSGIGIAKARQKNLFKKIINFDAQTNHHRHANITPRSYNPGRDGKDNNRDDREVSVSVTFGRRLSTGSAVPANGAVSAAGTNSVSGGAGAAHGVGASRGSFNGSGLGLYITKGLVELHGGTISVASEGPDLGSVFTVKIPFDNAKARMLMDRYSLLSPLLTACNCWRGLIMDPIVETYYLLANYFSIHDRKDQPVRVRVVSSELVGDGLNQSYEDFDDDYYDEDDEEEDDDYDYLPGQGDSYDVESGHKFYNHHVGNGPSSINSMGHHGSTIPVRHSRIGNDAETNRNQHQNSSHPTAATDKLLDASVRSPRQAKGPVVAANYANNNKVMPVDHPEDKNNSSNNNGTLQHMETFDLDSDTQGSISPSATTRRVRGDHVDNSLLADEGSGTGRLFTQKHHEGGGDISSFGEEAAAVPIPNAGRRVRNGSVNDSEEKSGASGNELVCPDNGQSMDTARSANSQTSVHSTGTPQSHAHVTHTHRHSNAAHITTLNTVHNAAASNSASYSLHSNHSNSHSAHHSPGNNNAMHRLSSRASASQSTHYSRHSSHHSHRSSRRSNHSSNRTSNPNSARNGSSRANSRSSSGHGGGILGVFIGAIANSFNMSGKSNRSPSVRSPSIRGPSTPAQLSSAVSTPRQSQHGNNNIINQTPTGSSPDAPAQPAVITPRVQQSHNSSDINHSTTPVPAQFNIFSRNVSNDNSNANSSSKSLGGQAHGGNGGGGGGVGGGLLAHMFTRINSNTSNLDGQRGAHHHPDTHHMALSSKHFSNTPNAANTLNISPVHHGHGHGHHAVHSSTSTDTTAYSVAAYHPQSHAGMSARVTASKPVPGHLQAWLTGFHVLLVDDAVTNLKMVTMLMKRLGCRCTTAANGLEAIEIMTVKGVDGFDFVIMDNYMPIMDGCTASIQLREMGFTRPIIGLTGHALGEDLIAFKEAGANAVLTKPLDVTELKSILSLLMNTAATYSDL